MSGVIKIEDSIGKSEAEDLENLIKWDCYLKNINN